MKGKRLCIFICIILVLSVFSGCQDSNSNAENGNPKEVSSNNEKTFTYAVSDDPGNTLNVLTADDRVSLMMAKLVATPLYSMNADGSLNYYIAENLEPSEDGLTYTCKLKSGITWSDGEPVTADDVVFTYEEFIKEDNGQVLTINGQPIKVKKIDDENVEFKLPAVSASIKENLCTPFIVPKHVFEGKEDVTVSLNDKKIVGTGPYIFDEYKAGEYISFTKNPSYMNGEANIDKIILRIIKDDDTAKLALKNGEIDAWIGLPSKMNGLEKFTVTPYSEGRIAYLRLNRVSDNMKDYSFLPKNNSYYTENVEKYEQNIEKSKKLTAEGSRKLSLCYIGTDPAQKAEALVIQAQLKIVGLDVELNGLDQAAYMAAAYDNDNKNYDMYLGGYIMTFDPDGFRPLYGTGQMMNFASEKVDNLFEQGKTELDPKKRAKIYDELQMEVSKEALFYPFGENLRILVTNSEIKGIKEAGLVPIYTFEDMSGLSR